MSNNCVCTVVNDPDGPEMGSWIRYCPLHAAAPALLEALEVLHDVVDEGGIAVGPALDAARAAIKQAKGGENG